jgi:hypothetical protein
MNGKIIAEKLLNIEDAILGVQNNPKIQEMMSLLGYTPEQMKEGKMLLDKVTTLMTVQVEGYSNQYLASEGFHKLWKSTYGNYMVTLKVIRVAFNGQVELLERFNAVGRRNRSLSGWLRDARILYTNLLNSSSSLDVMARYGYTVEKLTKEFQGVTEVEQLHSKQLSEKGTAKQSTLDRDKAFDELYKWYAGFRAIARIALYETPQLLDALGIKANN